MEASSSWNPQGLSRPVMGLLYHLTRINGKFSEEGMLMAAKQQDVVPPQAKKACRGACMDSSTHFYHHHWTQVCDQLHK